MRRNEINYKSCWFFFPPLVGGGGGGGAFVDKDDDERDGCYLGVRPFKAVHKGKIGARSRMKSTTEAVLCLLTYREEACGSIINGCFFMNQPRTGPEEN